MSVKDELAYTNVSQCLILLNVCQALINSDTHNLCQSMPNFKTRNNFTII